MTVQISTRPLVIQTSDGTVVGQPSVMKLPNGVLTDNGDGSFTMARSPVLSFANTSVPVGNTVANTTTETPFTSTYTLPANTLKVGSVIRVKMYGIYGTNIVAPSLTGKFKIGSTVILNTGALTSVAGVTNGGWSADALITVDTIGVGGTVEAQGFAQFATAATTGLSVNVGNTTTFAVDTTIDEIFSVTVTWSSANSANTITLRQMAIEVIT